MKRLLLFFAAICFFNLQTIAQVIITSADMAAPGDTVRKSNTIILDGIDYELAGPDQTWLFDGLTVVSQQIDTFLNVSETPGIYQLFFNNNFIYPDYKATVAQKLGSVLAIPGLVLGDSYLFIKNTAEESREVGYGVNLGGVDLPIQFQEIDTIYRFPVEYGDIDSAHSMFNVDVPNLGFLLISKTRRNTVDGWGSLTTPFGEFQTLRVKTEITEYDSLFSDSLGIGIPVIRNYIEYKWLANGYPEPILTVTDEAGIGASASYIDSVRTTFVDVPEIRKPEFSFIVYPNPCSDYLSIRYELEDDADVIIAIYSIYGSEIKRFSQTRQERGYYNQMLYLKENGFRNGVYLLKLTVNNIPYVRKIVVN